MTKGEGKAESCEGFLFVEETAIGNLPTVWSHDNARHYDIGGYMNLRLFKVEEEHDEYTVMKIEKSITFPSAKLEKGFAEIRKPYKGIIDKRLTVRIYAKRGKVPEPFAKRISDIIKDAMQDSSLDEPISSKYTTSEGG